MFIEELTRIQEVEAKTEQMLKEAKASSKRNLEDAKTHAAKILADAEGKAKDIYDALIREGEQTSADEYANFLSETENYCIAMVGQASAKKQQAVDLIAERIVSASVNR